MSNIGKYYFVLFLFLIVCVNSCSEPEEGQYSYSFIDNYPSAARTNFNEELILANYLPLDNKNSFFKHVYDLSEKSGSSTEYENVEGKVIRNSKKKIKNGYLDIKYFGSDESYISHSIVFRQENAKNYYLLKIDKTSNYDITLFVCTDSKLSVLKKLSFENEMSKPTNLRIIFIEDRLFIYINGKVSGSLIVARKPVEGFFSVSSSPAEYAGICSVKIVSFGPQILKDSKLSILLRNQENYNFTVLNFSRHYQIKRDAHKPFESKYLRRLKCYELSESEGFPYLHNTKPSIIFLSNSQLSYEIKIPENSVLFFSLANIQSSIDSRYRSLFSISITDGSSVDSYEYKFNHLNKTFKSYFLNLKKWAGKRCTISFKLTDSQKREISSPAELMIALGAPVIYTKPPPTRKNVILISLDTLRQDHLSCYAYDRKTSPSLDAFAKKSLVFNNAVANSNSTLPSHMSMFTSLYPSESGHQFKLSNYHFIENTIPETIKCLGEYVRPLSMKTGAITGGNWVSSWIGYDRGFDDFIEWTGLDMQITYERAINWLESNKKYNFFLFLHTYEIHKPYSRDYFLKNSHGKIAGIKDRMIARYDSGIRYTDQYLGKLFKWLKENNLFENTLIIITSDHGENFEILDGFDNLPGTHGRTLYDSEIKIPLMVGGAKGFYKQGICNFQVSNVDILPTILEYLEIEPERQLRGKSLVDLTATSGDLSSRTAFSENMILYNDKRGFRSLRTVVRKLIQKQEDNTVSYEFYNLANDPEEKENLVNVDSKKVDVFKHHLSKIISSLKIIKRNSSNLLQFNKDTFSSVQKSLMALGYLGN